MRFYHSLASLPVLIALGCPSRSEAFIPTAFQNNAVLQTKARTVKDGLIFHPSPNPPGFHTNSPAFPGLSASKSTEEEVSTSSWTFNPLFASLWLGFFAFAALGPGEVFSPDDTAMINAYIENPSDPGFSEGFQLIFNYLGLMPIIIACTAVPQASPRGLPPLPFLIASFGMGYGAVGPYLSFRAPPREEYVPNEASWFTRNVLESKILGWGLVAGVIALPFYVGLVDAVTTDASAAIQSYSDLFATSKLVSASSVDALILNAAAATLIPRDLKLRQSDMEDSQAKLIGASTLLLPFLGAALYCALRPALPSRED